mgnify:CR=1 FL=1
MKVILINRDPIAIVNGSQRAAEDALNETLAKSKPDWCDLDFWIRQHEIKIVDAPVYGQAEMF